MSNNVEESTRKNEEKNQWKTIIYVFLIVALVYLIPVAFDYIATGIGTSFNPTNPNLYQYDTTIVFEYENGTRGNSQELEFDITPDEEKTFTQVEVILNGVEISSYLCEFDTGYLKDTESYTIFWIFTLNNLLNPLGNLLENDEVEVVDPIGLLGPVNETYTYAFVQKVIYWQTPPLLHGAQYSYEVDIFNSENNKIGKATLDSTSGILEIIDGTSDFRLIDPGIYPLSRHRLTIFIGVMVAMIVIPASIYSIYKYRKKKDKQFYETLTLLTIMGGSAILTDFILDVWMYSFFGIFFMFSLHIFLAIVYGAFSWKMKVHPIWITPLILEMAFPIALALHAGVPLYPSLTIGLGSFSTFLFVLFRTAREKPLF